MALGVTVDVNMNLVKLSGQVDKLAGNLDRFQAHAEGMSDKVNGAFGAIGVGLSVAGITAFVKSGIDAADALNDMADRTGIAVEKLDGFRWATHLADTDMESFASSVNKLSIFIAKNADDMQKLGVSAKDPAEAFLQFADVFSKIEDPQRRAALGAAVLGKSYAEMAPLLLQGADALRQQVRAGQEMSGITAEQAKAAGEFNDKLDAMGNRFIGMQSKISLGILVPFANMAESMNVAIERGGVLQGVLDGIVNGSRNTAFGTGGGLSLELDDLNVRIADAKEKLSKTQDGGIFGKNSSDEAAAQKEVNSLLNERIALIEKISNGRKKTVTGDVTVDDSAVNALIKLGGETDKVAKKTHAAADANARRRDGVNELIKMLQFEISITGQNEEQQRRLSEIRSATSKATGSEVEAITKLVNAKYALREADDILAEGEKLAARQRADAAADYDRLNQRFNGKSLDFNAGLSDALDARASGIIPDDAKLKEVLDKMGRDYNGLAEDAKDATDSMSEYAIQAARSMQSAFSDFLFDPFSDSAESMSEKFLNVLKRMAADAASAQIMEGLMGKTGVKDGGGLLGTLFSSVAGSVFHDGGIAGQGTRSMSLHPSVFAGAPRYHSGGIAGLAPNEVPAILQKGELVISNKQLAGVQSGSGDVSITTQVSVSGGNSDNSNMQALGGMINARVKEVIMSEKRPGGLLA